MTPGAREGSPVALEVEGLRVHLGGRRVLEDVSFRVPAGSLVGVIGPNGAGKSTLLRAILGVIAVDAGRVQVLGQAGRVARRELVWVPQRGDVVWDFPLTVSDVVAQGRWPTLGLFRRMGPEDRRRVDEALERTGMTALRDRGIDALSGGQQQRMFLARALAQDGRVLLLDEPFAGVDALSEGVLHGVLREQRESGRTVVVVHHDLGTAATLFDHVILLNRSVVASGPTSEVLVPTRLAAAYGEGLLALGRLVAAPSVDDGGG